jgi:Tol biopolymer transport system component
MMREKDIRIGFRRIALVFMACLLGVSVFPFAQSASALLEQGLMKENAEGDLSGAIAIFNRIVEDQAADAPIRAKAQLQIGMCYEKLGRREAQVAYQKVIDSYPQQLQEVAQARERIARLVAASKEEAVKPTFRKLHIPNKLMWDAQVSPDGKNIALVNDFHLWITPLSSRVGPGFPGTPRRLDTQGVEADWAGFTWSADGQWIAFNGKEVKDRVQQIYIVPVAGGTPKELYENNRDARVVNYRMSLSPHGKTIAFASKDAGLLHIYTKPVAGGSPERLVDNPAREPVFSPNAKWIAYVEDKALGHGGGGVWVIPAGGGKPQLVAKAGNASSPIWSPDGTMLAFVDYDANKKIHIVQLGTDGTPTGKKASIDCPEGIAGVRRLAGWMPDNQIGAITETPIDFALYAQPVEGGKARFVTHGGYPIEPRWSPDGKRIFHLNKADKTSGNWERLGVAFVPPEGGDAAIVPLQSDTKIRLWGYGTGDLLSPDGNTLVFAGQKPEEGKDTMHIWALPVEGGTPRQLTDAAVQDWYPCWSPDGENIAFVRATPPENWAVIGRANIFVVSAEGGEPRQITSESDRVFTGPVMWSPDGKLLAYFSRDKDDSSEGAIKVIPAGGGEPKVVARAEKIFANKEMAWSPDSRRIAWNAPDKKIKIVSLEDGSVEEIVPDLQDVKEIYHLDWSPDGKTLVFGGYSGGGPEFWTIGNLLPLTTAAK